MLATVATAVSVVVRGAHAAWEAQENDYHRLEAAHAVVLHVVRGIRQATAVTAVTDPSEVAGSLSLLMPTGDTHVWDRDSGTDEVNFGVSAASDLLAEGITALTFTAYEADGVTPTTTVDDVHSIKCQVTVQLTQGGGTARSVSCWAWLRSW